MKKTEVRVVKGKRFEVPFFTVDKQIVRTVRVTRTLRGLVDRDGRIVQDGPDVIPLIEE